MTVLDRCVKWAFTCFLTHGRSKLFFRNFWIRCINTIKSDECSAWLIVKQNISNFATFLYCLVHWINKLLVWCCSKLTNRSWNSHLHRVSFDFIDSLIHLWQANLEITIHTCFSINRIILLQEYIRPLSWIQMILTCV